MLPSRCLLIVLLAASVVAESTTRRGPWTPRSLARYARAREGVWHGRGRLTNTLTGNRIADADFLEKVTASGATGDDSAAFGSRRVVIYRTADGKRPTKPLHYDHNISASLTDGNLLLRANSGERVVASGWAMGRGPSRAGLRRAYDLSVRPIAKDAAADAGPPPSDVLPGWPRTAKTNFGVTREEYRLDGARRPGGRRRLFYKRTGRCPTWYGGGVCTLEVEAHAEPLQLSPLRLWRRWRTRRQHGATEVDEDRDGWERLVEGLEGSSED